MLVRLAAALLLIALLWSAFRYAMALRYGKVRREEERRAQEEAGRSVVAELPLPEGIVLFLEDGERFAWGEATARKADIVGARLRLNGGTMATAARAEAVLPEPEPPEEYEGRERWDVVLYLLTGAPVVVPCGTLREGVSRETAAAVFAAVRGVLHPEGRKA
jgi:hypothetical protein